jgi:hypothetical protein
MVRKANRREQFGMKNPSFSEGTIVRWPESKTISLILSDEGAVSGNCTAREGLRVVIVLHDEEIEVYWAGDNYRRNVL